MSGEVDRWPAPSRTAPPINCPPQLARRPHLGVPAHGRGGDGTLLLVHHLVLVPAQPAVGAAREHAVGLGGAGDVAGYKRTREAFVVDEGGAGADPVVVVASVGPHRHRPVFQMQQIGGGCVAPADRAPAAVGEHRPVLVARSDAHERGVESDGEVHSGSAWTRAASWAAPAARPTASSLRHRVAEHHLPAVEHHGQTREPDGRELPCQALVG